ncbi:MltA-interacting MipA family protein [Rhodomicrobium vannielii ATCC 17100]|uniref:MltA-interacting MipA family protein n=1 Tax=Rhodomicrobium vannielii (strain ATCC 17100 / DSM 162 / LMG 4299 / NCIMB 10020 / ATH 3.1.1) TaxID=648757 RepID=E3I629_RHOVT|nr:MipA/OmpV family protein [Rhodomicrobium vannielii]ADP70622.1 MltA-interacting MipA family protein [Rhodomicrobium vannielii ATCC 17100]
MVGLKQAAACVAFLGLAASGAQASDLFSADGGYKDGAAAPYWVVTVGGYAAVEPSFPGSKETDFTFRPIFDFYRAGESEWLSLPNDSFGFTLYQTSNFRFGVAGNYIDDRNVSDDRRALQGLQDIDYTIQLGGFAEYYPVPFIRTRIEVLQGITGAEGFEANLIADFIYRPAAQWQFTVGPRLKFVDGQYNSEFFSTPASYLNLGRAYNADGGLNSWGVSSSARYDVNERWSIRGFAEWNRLEGDAADSPLVKLRGDENQWQAGIGAAYKFNFAY